MAGAWHPADLPEGYHTPARLRQADGVSRGHEPKHDVDSLITHPARFDELS